MPWADGTPCGQEQWCLKGECRYRDKNQLRKVDGEWGEWQEYVIKYHFLNMYNGGNFEMSYKFCFPLKFIIGDIMSHFVLSWHSKI